MKHISTGSFILAALMTTSAFASRGTGSSGGGSGYVYSDGSVKLVDLKPSSSGIEKDAAKIQKRFFEQNRFVKTPATASKTFFQCVAGQVAGLPQATEWVNSLSRTRVLMVEFPLISIDGALEESSAILEAQALPLFAENGGDHEPYQVALASYSQGDLWVQNRFFQAMSSDERCGLSVHEAVRHLNYTRFIHHPLATSEIESLTRAIMEKDATTAESMLNAAYQKNQNVDLIPFLNAVRGAENAIQQAWSSNGPTALRLEIQAISLGLRDLERSAISLIQEGGNSQVMSKTGDEALKVAQAMTDLRMNHQFSAPVTTLLKDAHWELLNVADTLYTGSALGMLNQIRFPSNLWDRVWVGISLTEKLPGLKKLDVSRMKIVKRL